MNSSKKFIKIFFTISLFHHFFISALADSNETIFLSCKDDSECETSFMKENSFCLVENGYGKCMCRLGYYRPSTFASCSKRFCNDASECTQYFDNTRCNEDHECICDHNSVLTISTQTCSFDAKKICYSHVECHQRIFGENSICYNNQCYCKMGYTKKWYNSPCEVASCSSDSDCLKSNMRCDTSGM